ncbi:ABC transporter ATP-binding protein [Alkalicella caledoniensis]|uniref:ABC transporter ATP-binding protein n=1 Tax=Alkalicella caledoniensis TaxID=2731377 RepID=A0A7G9W465_ALKCA|nr:ABC transporter ATP-binding protein [Alkalicella caledoniensis]QNO13477.1 ABC transporter ATP-binding protein [Alkalicella caledoniensis]
MSSLSIDLQNINKAYDKRVVLKEINIKIAKNDYIAIVGKSGSGKSTLMNILGLIEYWDDGIYSFNGTSLVKTEDHWKMRLEKIGFIFQNYNLIPSLTCKENILVPTLYYKGKKQDLDFLAHQLDIFDLLDTSVSVLSGGEKQRVAIARALILNPQIIIADEPTGNLDEENKDIVLKLIDDAHSRGCAVVLITHDANVARRASRVYELKGGYLHEKD